MVWDVISAPSPFVVQAYFLYSLAQTAPQNFISLEFVEVQV